jgi:isochorismate synthase
MEEGLIFKKSLANKLKLSDYFDSCVQNGYGCAIYRLPNKASVHMIIDFSGGENLNKVEIENLKSGFVFHPFSAEHHDIKYINQDLHLIQEKGHNKPEILHSILPDDEVYEKFNPSNLINHTHARSSTKIEEDRASAEKTSFIELIDHSIRKINANVFQKIVLSRTKNTSLPDGFSPVLFFESLNEKYTNAFNHLTYIPGIGTWAGATPEILINIDRNNHFQTVALAATQSYDKGVGLENTTWSQKDIEEQAMVSRYIINCFKKIRLREFEEIGPRSYLSGNLVHLRTNYIVNLNQINFPELGSVMLDLLHPTSAVCGMPKDLTQNFIEQHEGFDRSYFSGYLGPVNVQDETNIFVNLRCAKLEDDNAQLFAGAGIISNSNPAKEWKETELKMDTILSVINEM